MVKNLLDFLGDSLAAAPISGTNLPNPVTPSPSGSTPGMIEGEHFGPEFWERFLTSAGFGGLMAVVAALVAGSIALAQFRHAKRQQYDERWWGTLTWVYDRTVVEEGKKPALPQRVTLAMLSTLSERVGRGKADRLRGEAISSILTVFEAVPTVAHEVGVESGATTEPGTSADAQPEDRGDDDRPGIPEPREGEPTDSSHGAGGPLFGAAREAAAGSIKVTDRQTALMLENLRDDLSDKGFSGRETAAAFAYEAGVGAALTIIAPELDSRVIRYDTDYGVDYLVVRTDGATIAVVVKYARSSISGSVMIKWAEKLRMHSKSFDRVLLVTNRGLNPKGVGLRKFMEMTDGRFVVWRNDMDSRILKAVLLERFEGLGD
ncbi:hypothetical protein NIE79_001436 [Micromonospora sp. NIE79]|uniref:Restriction endonuclease type IV Mrr domain-containing protein n=1 Tax=Micromonospora trifolii TaxID=2911208 RepID=A0ABS9MW84_9ACTN|nr:hypothetical protein [Micromonospora trifolii]MCG5441314.1 hypothetical protein [Micromonospora trifolii]